MPSSIDGVPAPRLERLEDLSPFMSVQMDKMGPGRRFHDTIVVKGTFHLAPGRMQLSMKQRPVVFTDEPFDASLGIRSSLKRAGEVLLCKPGADVFVTGTARAPRGEAVRTWSAGVVVSDASGKTILSQALEVTGPRVFQHRALRGWTVGDPAPATEAPIRYELSYGGAYPDPRREDGALALHDPNPSGTGFFDQAKLDKDATYPAPRWQSPAHPVSGINADLPIAGLGPVPRPWASRLKYAGTYDAAWERRAHDDAERGLPIDYPADFDVRFFNCAPPSLTAAKPLAGDEQITLVGLVADHPRLVTELPRIAVRAALTRGTGAGIDLPLTLDTVHFDLDAMLVSLSWRIALDHRFDIRAAVIRSEHPA